MVSRIDLDRTTGEVAQKLEARIQLRGQRLGRAHVKVLSLPPGLEFDAEGLRIVGVPEANGFYSVTVTVTVRKKCGSGGYFSTPRGAWFSERFCIDIYRPIDERGEPDARQDRGVASIDR
ncbi:MAG: hypothetical protein GY811_16995 [Myxococcales bacterium]|nr:hypothetical protein [Myxococcales bacterium]